MSRNDPVAGYSPDTMEQELNAELMDEEDIRHCVDDAMAGWTTYLTRGGRRVARVCAASPGADLARLEGRIRDLAAAWVDTAAGFRASGEAMKSRYPASARVLASRAVTLASCAGELQRLLRADARASESPETT